MTEAFTGRLEDHRFLQPWRLDLVRRSVGRHSEILLYRSQKRARLVIVKRITCSSKSEQAEATVAREFASLHIVRNRLPRELLHTVATPLMLLRDPWALVLEPLSGEPLSVILKREANRLAGPLRRSRMLTVGQLAGYWLSELHQATRIDAFRHDSRVFLAELEERLGRCHSIAAEAIARLWQLMREASRQLDGQLMPAAACQDDFIPQNLLIDGNRLGVVDFEAFTQSGAVYEDVATFMAYVQALSTHPYYSQTALRALTNSFLQAYGLSGDERPLRLYLARALVVLISEMRGEWTALYGRKRFQLIRTPAAGKALSGALVRIVTKAVPVFTGSRKGP